MYTPNPPTVRACTQSDEQSGKGPPWQHHSNSSLQSNDTSPNPPWVQHTITLITSSIAAPWQHHGNTWQHHGNSTVHVRKIHKYLHVRKIHNIYMYTRFTIFTCTQDSQYLHVPRFTIFTCTQGCMSPVLNRSSTMQHFQCGGSMSATIVSN